MSIDVFNLILDGLGTRPAGLDDSDANADCGMRGLVDEIFVPAPGIITESRAWDESDLATECPRLFARMEALSPRRVHIFAHSFGNNPLVALGDFLEEWYDGDGEPWIDVAVGFDPCKLSAKNWRLSKAIKRAVTFYQRGGRPFGVSGTPFDGRAGLTQYDVTDRRRVKVDDHGIVHVEDFGDGPDLGHIDYAWMRGIIMEPEVRRRVQALFLT